MALELRTFSSGQSEANPELTDMSRRFWVSSGFTLPILIAGMSGMWPMRMALASWVEFALATPVVLWGGWPFFQRFWWSIINRSPNMFTLIGAGTGAAYFYSVVATVIPEIFPVGFQLPGGTVPLYFEAAAVITTLVLLGQVLELRARAKTSGAIRSLLGLAPKSARLVRGDGREIDIPLVEVKPGDKLRVRPGEYIPSDGVVLEGMSSVDESLISGEPVPVEKAEGAHVIGGSLNGTGSFIMTARKVGSETVLARIVRSVSEAQRSHAPIQRVADRVASWFVPAIVISAVATCVLWATLGPEPRLVYAILNAVAVLIIACPCALGLATPMSIMVGTGRGALSGILLRDAAALERLSKVDTLVIDKTGTITEGKPGLGKIISTDGLMDPDRLLYFAASLEKGSEHPLAAAIVHAAEERGIRLSQATGFQYFIGRGLSGMVDGKRIGLGNEQLFRERGLDVKSLSDAANNLRRQGHSVVFLEIDGSTAALLSVADPIRPLAREAIDALQGKNKIAVIMLTGDNEITARAVAEELDIDSVVAGVQPDKKAAVIRGFQQEGHIVAMAGDGMNDAPALAQADVGIAMGTGADIAIESAAITLVRGDLRGIVRSIKLSRLTMSNIRQNLFFAFIYNTIGVPVAAGLLYPVFGILLSPMIASVAMTFSSVSVIANALRLRRAVL
jgi:Cu+-exporting ATPase